MLSDAGRKIPLPSENLGASSDRSSTVSNCESNDLHCLTGDWWASPKQKAGRPANVKADGRGVNLILTGAWLGDLEARDDFDSQKKKKTGKKNKIPPALRIHLLFP